MVKENLVKVLRSATIVSAALLSVANTYAYQGSGGNTTSGCDTDNNIYSYTTTGGACEFSGIGWLYFEYEEGFTGSLIFGPASENSGGFLEISSECTKYGGFWHYGYYQYKQYSRTYGNTRWEYWGFGHAGNPAYNRAGSDVNRDKNIELVNSNPGQVFYVNDVKAASAMYAMEEDVVKGYYDEYIAASGDSDIWGESLNYFCWGKEMQKTTFEGRINTSSYSDEVTSWTDLSNNSSRQVVGNSANLSFTHQMRRHNNGIAGIAYGFYDVDASISGYGVSSSQGFSKNSGWTNVHTSSMVVPVSPGGSTVAYQDLEYSDTVAGERDVQSWSDAPQSCTISGYVSTGRRCISLYRNTASFTGYVDARVTTDDGGTQTNPSNVIMTTDGNYKVEFQHSVTRGADGAGGTVSTAYSTNVSGKSDRYNPMTADRGSSHSGTSTAITEGSSTVVVSYATETITGTLYPEESRTFCQSLNYNSIIDVDGNTGATTGSRCVTVKRVQATCSIDGSSYGVRSGENIAKMTVMNSSNGQTSSIQGSNSDVASVWAKPSDLIRYSYNICASGQLLDDYHNGENASTSNFVFTGSNTTAGANSHKYLFGNKLGNGNVNNYTISIGANATYNSADYETSATSPSTTDSTYACKSTTTNKYYQIPDHNSLNCGSAIMVGRDSDAGSVISQTLVFNKKKVSANGTGYADNSNVTLKGDVKVPYNYDLQTSSPSTNPSSVPVSAGSSFNISFKIDVTPRCNAQVQGDCDDDNGDGVPDETYKTAPKKTKYRIITWTEGKNVTINNLKNSIGTAIKNSDDEVIGYKISTDPKNIYKYRVIGSGDDLFATNQDSVIVSSTSTIDVSSTAEIGSKVCTAVAVWPMDSHDLPGWSEINDNSQGAAFKSGSTVNSWRVSQPNCYTVGKKPSMAVRNASLYAYNGVEASTSKRTINGSEYLFGSWSEYGLVSADGQIIGMASGAGFWGGNNEVVSASGRACEFSAMTLANADCSANKLGQIELSRNVSSSPYNIKEQMITRYTSALSSSGTSIPDLGNAEVNIQGYCQYNDDAKTYIKKSSDTDSNYTCLPNGAAYVYSSQTLSFSNESTSQAGYGSWLVPFAVDSYSSRTYVIHAKKIILNRNIYYASDALEEHTSYHNNTVFITTANIPQVILIADEIVIGESVRNVDAWLIADNIDTCGVDWHNNAFNNTTNKINVTNCNRQLQVNGPVITRNLKLNRTHGGGGNSLYIIDYPRYYGYIGAEYSTNASNKRHLSSPAEIFTISPEVYFWTYAEGTRFSQAATTYQRELPTRY